MISITDVDNSLKTLKMFIDPIIEADIEAKTAYENVDEKVHSLFDFMQSEATEKDEEISGLNSDLEERTTDEIDMEKLDTLNWGLENGNLWCQQIMENIAKIVEKRGVKYLLDRLEITVLSFK